LGGFGQAAAGLCKLEVRMAMTRVATAVAAMKVVAVRLDWGGVEWAAVGLRELGTQAMLLERRCQQGEAMRGRRDSKLDMARVRSRQAQLAR